MTTSKGRGKKKTSALHANYKHGFKHSLVGAPKRHEGSTVPTAYKSAITKK